MGRKLYFEQEDKSIIFRTNRRIGDVRIPNYVYDIWMPIIGSDSLGIYGVYCRLEMNGSVKKITQRTLAKACRIGVAKLNKTNKLLEECGFISVDKPAGFKRLMHFTTEITVNDPPQEVPIAIIEKHCPDFEPLTPWLTSPETPNGVSDDTKQVLDETPNGAANIAALGLQSLDVETSTPFGEVPPVSNQESAIDQFFGDDGPRDETTPVAKPVTTEKRDAVLDIVNQAARRNDPLWFLKPGQPAGDHDYREPMLMFCDVVGREPATLGAQKALGWERQLEKIATVATGEDLIKIAPGVMAEAIKAIRGDWNFEQKRWVTPFSEKFAALVEHTAAQISTGTLPGMASTEWSGAL